MGGYSSSENFLFIILKIWSQRQYLSLSPLFPLRFQLDCYSLRMLEQIELFMEFFSDRVELAKWFPFFKIEDVLCFLLNFDSSYLQSNLTLLTLLFVMGSRNYMDCFSNPTRLVRNYLSSLILGFARRLALILFCSLPPCLMGQTLLLLHIFILPLISQPIFLIFFSLSLLSEMWEVDVKLRWFTLFSLSKLPKFLTFIIQEYINI